jgi:hypothetical protein
VLYNPYYNYDYTHLARGMGTVAKDNSGASRNNPHIAGAGDRIALQAV